MSYFLAQELNSVHPHMRWNTNPGAGPLSLSRFQTLVMQQSKVRYLGTLSRMYKQYKKDSFKSKTLLTNNMR